MPELLGCQTQTFRPTTVEVDLAAVRSNIEKLSGGSGAEVMAVVKADAYGHGMVDVAKAAVQAGASWLGVALVEEGLRLRDAGFCERILLFSETPRGAERAALDAGLTPTIYTRDGLDRVAAAAADRNGRSRVHIKVNTGMNRVGVPPQHAVELAQEAVSAGLEVEGLWTHFAKAEVVHDDFTDQQFGLLQACSAALSAAGVHPPLIHAANTAATLWWPDTHQSLIRIGIGMFGVSPAEDVPVPHLMPAMRWASRVSHVKVLAAGEALSYDLTYRLAQSATIATVPVGYADGYPRVLSNNGSVLINGRRNRVVGTVTMDQILVDCGTDAVAEGDEVVLLGKQGDEQITAWELAAHAGSIPDELITAISVRVPRVYRGQSEDQA